jgi:Plastocyanin
MKNSISSISRLIIGATVLLTLLNISNSCTKSSTTDPYTSGGTGSKGVTTPGVNEVWIQGMAFNPSTITITTGTTITWTNKDGMGHSVTSDTGIFDSGIINANGTFSYKFDTAGTFTYHCIVDPLTMTASVVVKSPSLGY